MCFGYVFYKGGDWMTKFPKRSIIYSLKTAVSFFLVILLIGNFVDVGWFNSGEASEEEINHDSSFRIIFDGSRIDYDYEFDTVQISSNGSENYTMEEISDKVYSYTFDEPIDEPSFILSDSSGTSQFSLYSGAKYPSDAPTFDWSKADENNTMTYIITKIVARSQRSYTLLGFWKDYTDSRAKNQSKYLFIDTTLFSQYPLFITSATERDRSSIIMNNPAYPLKFNPNVPNTGYKIKYMSTFMEPIDYLSQYGSFKCESDSGESLPLVCSYDYSSVFIPENINFDNKYWVELPENCSEIMITGFPVYGYNLRLKIPQELENPCYYLGSCAYGTGYNSNGDYPGIWDEVESVNTSGDYVTTQYQNISTMPSNNFKYLNCTVYDYYNDADLSGRTYINSNTSINQLSQILSVAMSDYYKEANKAYYDYYTAMGIRDSSPVEGSYYSQQYGIVDPIYTGMYNISMTANLEKLNLFGFEKSQHNSVSIPNISGIYAVSAENRIASNFFGSAMQNGANGRYGTFQIYQGIAAEWLDDAGNILMNTFDPDSEIHTEVIMPFFNKEFLRGDNSFKSALGYVYEDMSLPFKYDSNTKTYTFVSNLKMYRNIETGENILAPFPSSSTSAGSYFFPLRHQASPTSIENGGFGIHMDIPFILSEDSNEYSFSLKSDDDCWVYVDGQLILDYGGAHAYNESSTSPQKCEFTINILENTINGEVNPVKAYNNTITVNKQLGLDLGKKVHTISIFYLERATGNGALEFSTNVPIQFRSVDIDESVDVPQNMTENMASLLKNYSFNFDIKNPVSGNSPVDVEEAAISGVTYEIYTLVNRYYKKIIGKIISDSFALKNGQYISIPYSASGYPNQKINSYIYIMQNLSEEEKNLFNVNWTYSVTYPVEEDVGATGSDMTAHDINHTDRIYISEPTTNLTSDDYQLAVDNPHYIHQISFVNTVKYGTIVISKSLSESSKNTSQPVKFKIEYENVGGMDVEGEKLLYDIVSVSPGKSVNIDIPLGTQYTVTEVEGTNIYEKNETVYSGIITKENEVNAEYDFTNTRLRSSLILNETITYPDGTEIDEKESEDFNKEFDIIVTLSSKYDNLFAEFEADGWEKVGENNNKITKVYKVSMANKVTIDNIPGGITYSVVEADESGEGYKVIYDNASGTITAEPTTANVINQRLASLSVKKTVKHSDGTSVDSNEEEYNKEFSFVVTLESENDNLSDLFADEGWSMVDESENKIEKTFSVSMAEGITVNNIPGSVKYSVKETDESREGYLVTNGDISGIIIEESHSVNIINQIRSDESQSFLCYVLWEDSDDKFGVRPILEESLDNYTLQYKKDNGEWTDYTDDGSTASLQPDEDNNNQWIYSCNGLLEYGYDEMGCSGIVIYRVIQTDVPEQYVSEPNTALDGQQIKNTVYGSLTVTKKGVNVLDSEEILLSGVEFKLYTSAADAEANSNAIQTLTTGDDGKCAVFGLAEGDYWLVETKTASGYRLLARPITFNISYENSETLFVEQQVVNYRSYELPKTGAKGLLPIYFFGITLILLSFLYILYYKRSKSMRQ